MGTGVFIAFLFIILSAILQIGLTYYQKKRPGRAVREIRAIERMRMEVNLSVEEGKRLHISIGNADILSDNMASALMGLSVVKQMAKITMFSDRPLIVTSGDGSLSILGRDVLHNSYQASNALKYFDPMKSQLCGVTPFSYAGGVISQLEREKVSCNLVIGSFGPEVAYLCGMGHQDSEFVFKASNSLSAQAVMFAAVEEPLIGEELFALPAYLQPESRHMVSLHVQDILRWVLIIALITGALIQLTISIWG